MTLRTRTERPSRPRQTRDTPPAAPEQRPLRQRSHPLASPATAKAPPLSPQNAAQTNGTQKKAPFPLPEGIDRAGAILLLVHELCAVAQEENQHLRTRRFADLAATLPRKQSVSQAYLEQMASVKNNPAILRDLPEERRAELRAAGETLSEIMTENAMLIQVNINTIQILIGNIVQAVKEQRSATSMSYSETGQIDQTLGDPKAMAIALNKEL